MTNGFLKTIIIVGTLILATVILYPTYEWYYFFDEQKREIGNTSQKELNSLYEELEINIGNIRSAIKNTEYYYLLESKKSSKVILDLRPEKRDYHLNLDFETLKKIVIKNNPDYKDFEILEKSFNTAKDYIAKIKEIEKYKGVRGKIIKLGLDLAGGVHFVVGVNKEELKKIIEDKYAPLMDKNKIIEELKSKGVEPRMIEEEAKNRIKQLEEEKEKRIENEEKEGIDRALLKIRNRIDQFGVAETTIRKSANNTITIELPGLKNKDAAKEVITKVGRLTFQLVNEELVKKVPLEYKDTKGIIVNKEYIYKLKTEIPNDTVLLWVQEQDKFGIPRDIGVLPVFKKVDLDGERIKDARVEYDPTGLPYIGFDLDSEGADIFASITKANVGNRLAIVLDDKIQSAPVIQTQITGGRAQITGSFSMEEAKTLAAILRAGSLPIPIQIEEERVVGPSLGKDQIQQGLNSSLLAMILVILVMIVYYKWSGLNASIAQLINVYFILAVMAQLGSTLTLPGIASIVLTIGMGVDANVIINERIKEELREGRGIESALRLGYSSAFRTIFDSNITTIFSGIILALVGTGPIKGFGIVLIIGLAANLFTSVFITRFIYDVFVYKFRIKKLSI